VRAIIFLLLRRLKFSRFYKPWTFSIEMSLSMYWLMVVPLSMYRLMINQHSLHDYKSSLIFKNAL
jgi:hypothetical protein